MVTVHHSCTGCPGCFQAGGSPETLRLREEVTRLRKKNSELNRRSQAAYSQARKDYDKELWDGHSYRKPAYDISRILNIDTSGKSFSTIRQDVVAALNKLLAAFKAETGHEYL